MLICETKGGEKKRIIKKDELANLFGHTNLGLLMTAKK